jgi:hypothetical protein
MISRLLRRVFETIKNLNTHAMKKMTLFLALLLAATFTYGQKSIDALFEKYAGKNGFTTVTINGNLLKMAMDDDDDDSMPADITEIRILAQDDDDNNEIENFYDMVIKDIDLNLYEEFMRVKESDQDLRMLVRSEGNRFKEFLLIAGGKDNAIIQVKGNMTYNEAKRFSSEAGKKHGLNITGTIDK